MRTEHKEIYIAEDGTVFQSKSECLKYEADIEKQQKVTTYWRIAYNPDLTEGRGWSGVMYVECVGPEYDAELWMRDWCHRTIGRPLAFVQGCVAMDNWRLIPVTRQEFMKPKPIGIGDSLFKPETKRLVVGPKEEGLVDPGLLES